MVNCYIMWCLRSPPEITAHIELNTKNNYSAAHTTNFNKLGGYLYKNAILNFFGIYLAHQSQENPDYLRARNAKLTRSQYNYSFTTHVIASDQEFWPSDFG